MCLKSGYLFTPSSGAHRCCHAEHQPQWDGGRGRGGGSWCLRRRRRGILGPWGREWPCGDTWFPKSWTSRFSLYEQSCQPGTVLHRHVTEWSLLIGQNSPICPFVGKKRMAEMLGESCTGLVFQSHSCHKKSKTEEWVPFYQRNLKD